MTPTLPDQARKPLWLLAPTDQKRCPEPRECVLPSSVPHKRKANRANNLQSKASGLIWGAGWLKITKSFTIFRAPSSSVSGQAN